MKFTFTWTFIKKKINLKLSYKDIHIYILDKKLGTCKKYLNIFAKKKKKKKN